MNLYLLSVDEYTYDEYDSFVVVAKSEEDAKNYLPTRGLKRDDKLDPLAYMYDLENWKDVLKVKVEFIGIAPTTTKEGRIIISSFNAE